MLLTSYLPDLDNLALDMTFTNSVRSQLSTVLGLLMYFIWSQSNCLAD